MTTKLSKRALSIILCLALLMSYLPLAAQAAQTGIEPYDAADDRVADPSTMDGWKDIFLSDPLNTENAGGVWTDKSVFTDATAFFGITQSDPDSFLVALSAMAANMTVTGMSNMPTDTMMILDLSSSMYDGYSRNPAAVRTMLASVNESIQKLQDLNEHNRVGVVVYYGGPDRNQSDSANSMVLLPLDRYSGTTEYLKANTTGGRLTSVSVASGVKNSSGATVAQTTRVVTDVAGTYAQLGILDAMDQLLAASTTVPATASYQPNAARVPVMIFMSDGEPTAATHLYTQKTDAGMGNNTVSIRNPNETDLVTQLTASYAKEMVDAHYVETDPLFYTLSLGTSVSLAVMDPSTNTTATIDGYWTKLLENGSVDITVYNSPNGWSAPTVKKTYTVSQTTVDGALFPSSKDQRDYVDKAFTAENASDLTAAFVDIIDHISIVSKFTPTLVSGNADLSGYISFVDKVGAYMEVTDIKGILIDDTLYSGAELARNFVSGGGALGTYDDPQPLGDEMVWAVQARLGLDSVDAARTLIGLAYEYGQLSYVDDTEYSNYIGWYANAAGQFLGFWHEGITTMPDPTGDAATDPAYIIKSYGYLGAVDESHGVAASDMMYATVQVRQSIATGEQTVAFAVPAALIPVITYEVELDMDGEMVDLTVTGAEHPIRLVYEVALDDRIDPFSLNEIVSEEYRAANTDESGKVSFYTNQYEADNSTGYGKVNTYSYFNPSRRNDRYYYLQDTPVYTDTNGTLYTGDSQPEGTYYRSYIVYEKDGAALNVRTVYRRLSDAALSTAKRADDGSWYIGAGNVHVNLDGYTITKSENATDTLPDANIPFVDTHDHTVGDLGYNFIVGATLGNNGRLSLAPATGIALTKTMADGAAAPTSPFRFTITNDSDGSDDGSYPAQLRLTDGTESVTTVQFIAGQATVELYAGQTLRIGGMTAGTTCTVREIQSLEYVPDVSAVTVTVEAGELASVSIVNDDRGEGGLTVSKEVIHGLGTDYTIPSDKIFTVDVILTGVGVADATFAAANTDGSVTSVTTDGDGRFTVALRDEDQITVFGLPEGTTAAVIERDPGIGFTPAYWEEGRLGDGIVTIADGVTVSVTVANTYETKEVDPVNVVLNGTKHLTTDASDWNGAQFQFQLQKWTEDGWSTIATASATESSPSFSFSDAMKAEKFAAPGTYYYQVLETNGGQVLEGITYDATLHTFGITVTDKDMDGQLEIDQVSSYHTGNAFQINEDGDWQIDIAFNNRYDAAGCDLVLDVQKALENSSGSPAVSLSGYQFGLYDGDDMVAVSELSDGVGEARFILHYELEDVGTHTYTLKEIVPDDPIEGMTYDDTAYTVVVQVVDNGDGTTGASILSIDGKTDFDTPVFTNVYDPDDVEMTLDFVRKTLSGRDMVAGEFSFQLRGTNSDIRRTGTNGADGSVIFEDALVFDRVGVWTFDLVETGTDGNGITLDKTVYNVTITVTDAGGQLVADRQVLNVVGDDVLFENSYTAKPTTYTIEGTKQLLGRVLLNEEFTFVLTQLGGDLTMEAKNFTDGSFRFAPLAYTQPGTYQYEVSEIPESGASFGITYDTTRYLVTVTVIDDLEGQLVVSDVTTAVIGGETADDIRFTNVYVPAPTSIVIPGSKTLNGKVLNGGDFRFELYESDADWSEGTLLETVENREDGSFCFSQIDHDTAGTYYYLVREVNGGQTIDGVTYDDTVFRAAVQVVDDLRGQLVATIHIYDDEDIPQESITFVNLYEVSGDAYVMLEGTKTLNGKELTDGAFAFELYQTDETFGITGEPVITTINVDGAFEMGLSYTAEDVGTTFYYLAREQFAGQVIDGVTYSDAEYRITVQVADDGIGGIETTTTINGGTATSLDFVNDYTADPVTVVLDGTKTLNGKALNGGDFRFELYETNESWFEISEPETVTNAADGSFSFAPITFTTPGTRYYLIREVNGGKTVDGVIYDDTIYCVIAEVADDGSGQLVCSLDICTSQGKPVEEMTFENDLIDPLPQTGDTGLGMWVTMLVVSCGGVISLLAVNKKKEEVEA